MPKKPKPLPAINPVRISDADKAYIPAVVVASPPERPIVETPLYDFSMEGGWISYGFAPPLMSVTVVIKQDLKRSA